MVVLLYRIVNTHSISSFKADERVYYLRSRQRKRIRMGTDFNPSAFPTATHDLCIAIDSEWQPE
jgi:hypothetical protein